MAKLLTDKLVKDLPKPETGMNIVRDKKVRGLGVRVLPSGTKAFILDYTIAGRRRIYTIGTFGEWQVQGAREKATKLKSQIRYDEVDPAAELKDARDAPTVADLCERFEEEHLPKLRPSTQGDYRRMMKNYVIPELGNLKVSAIRFQDVNALHAKIKKRGFEDQESKKKAKPPIPAAASYCMALCSKLFNYAIQLGWITINPAKGVERSQSEPRNRYLSMTEITSLTKALNEYPDQDVADIFRLLLFTGARRGETQSATWDQFDLKEGVWTKPAASTKQKREHRVPLAAPAMMLLANRRAKAEAELKKLSRQIAKADASERPKLEEWRDRIDRFVFPARDGDTGHTIEIKRPWDALCKAAGIMMRVETIDETGKRKVKECHGARIHDLRHTAASVLASSGVSLPLIGQLLGHTQAATTQRYAHLFVDAQRAAVERLGAVIKGGPSAEVIDLKGRRR